MTASVHRCTRALAPALVRLGLTLGAAVAAFAVASAVDQDHAEAHGSDTLLPGLPPITHVVEDAKPPSGILPRPNAATKPKVEAPVGGRRDDAPDRPGLRLRERPVVIEREDRPRRHIADRAKPAVREVREVADNVRPARRVIRIAEKVTGEAIPPTAESLRPLDHVTDLLRGLRPKLTTGVRPVEQVLDLVLPRGLGTGWPGCLPDLVTPDVVLVDEPAVAEPTAVASATAAPAGVALGPAATTQLEYEPTRVRAGIAAALAAVGADAPRPPPVPDLPGDGPGEVATKSAANGIDAAASSRPVAAPAFIGPGALPADGSHLLGRAPQPDASPA